MYNGVCAAELQGLMGEQFFRECPRKVCGRPSFVKLIYVALTGASVVAGILRKCQDTLFGIAVVDDGAYIGRIARLTGSQTRNWHSAYRLRMRVNRTHWNLCGSLNAETQRLLTGGMCETMGNRVDGVDCFNCKIGQKSGFFNGILLEKRKRKLNKHCIRTRISTNDKTFLRPLQPHTK